MSLEIQTLVLGPLATNTYVLSDEVGCAIVDPGMEPAELLEALKRHQAARMEIWLTHGHGDHIAGVAEIRAAYPDARICCPSGDANMLTDAKANMSGPFGFSLTSPPADKLLDPGQTLALGSTRWEVLDTSGHTRGGVSYYCRSGDVVLTGDSLFAGSIGRTDIPGGSASRLLNNIRRNLLALPDSVRMLPGHGGESTIGRERRSNPFLTGWAKLTDGN